MRGRRYALDIGGKDKSKSESALHKAFTEGRLRIVVETTQDRCVDAMILFKAKNLFGRQLSKMPGEYILRQVFDPKHACMMFVDEKDNVVAGICYRPFFERSFVEIVFLAVDYEFQVKGVGGFLMDVFKEMIKMDIKSYENDYMNDVMAMCRICRKEVKYLDMFENEPDRSGRQSLYLIAYADVFAVGFFKKQGFCEDGVFDKWIGYIKDYDGGTIVECKVFWEINYLRKDEVIELMRRRVDEEMRNVNGYSEMHRIEDYSKVKSVRDIPGINKGLDNMKCISKIDSGVNDMKGIPDINEGEERAGDKDKISEESEAKTTMRMFIMYMICDLKMNACAWPFLKPVSANDVPNYYKYIKKPMDISKMAKKVEDGIYKSVREFEEDVRQMITNCLSYNGKDTQYYKCGQVLVKHFEMRMETYKHVVDKIG
ncbi:chromatin remodeling transcription factor [Ordospora colligata]|nr:chromatin remodeling transcription factor [Ordospora colligata]